MLWMKNGVCPPATPCGSCNNLLYEGKYRVIRLLVTAKVVPSSPILLTLMIQAICSSETPVLTRATRRNIPEDVVLHRKRSENSKPYTVLWIFKYYNGINKSQFEFWKWESTNE
jgi:hypothetical protein